MPDRQDFRFSELKARQRDIRTGFPQDFGLRIHRMISWIGRAESEMEDPAAAFIFLWIASTPLTPTAAIWMANN